ncbi:MAG: hypothetical protein ACRC41_06340 [Sarcina sp.]
MNEKISVLKLSQDDIIKIFNNYLENENISIEKIKFLGENIEVFGSIKKIFVVKFSCDVSLLDYNNDKLTININSFKALKINLFDMLEKVIEKKFSNRKLKNFVIINGSNIILDLAIVKNKLKPVKFELQEIKIGKESLDLKLKNMDNNMLSLLKEKKNIGITNIKKQA